MSDSPVELERQGAVAVVAFNRPDRLNALNRAAVEGFGEIGKQLTASRDVRAVVITGRGERAFCAGADLKERRGMNEAQVKAQLLLCRRALEWIDAFPAPVIAAINGVCLGGGLEIALMCDLRIASAWAVLGLPETSLGIIPGCGGTQRLPRLIGEARAKEMILLARRVSAAEAMNIGLIHRVVDDDRDLCAATLEWIRPIVDGAPLAQRAALAAIDAARNATLAEGLDREMNEYETCLGSDDRVEALRAFAEKRPPRFEGR